MALTLKIYNTPNTLKRPYGKRRGRWGFYRKLCCPQKPVEGGGGGGGGGGSGGV